MTSMWDKTALVRAGLDATSTATSLGFTAARLGTRLGFSATRGLASTVASAVDYTVSGGRTRAGTTLSSTVSSALTLAERLALLPLDLGESLTSSSFVAAHSALSILFPGVEEAPFSLRAFISLVRRESANPAFEERLPPGQSEYGAAETARALVAWAALQAVTSGWKEREWLRHVREVGVTDTKDTPAKDIVRHEPRVHVKTDVVYPDAQGQVITAEIVDAVATPKTAKRTRTRQQRLSEMSDDEVKAALRRFSKLVLAGYGGASLLFFGVSPIPRRTDERASLASAIDASEAEAAATAPTPTSTPEKNYAWWNVLRGKHDADIFHSYANADAEPEAAFHRQSEAKRRAASAVVGDHGLMPRFWVLSDHSRREVVLVIRGTMSLNELAVDLTCTPEPFRPARASPHTPDETASMPGYAHFEAEPLKHGTPVDGPSYLVHGGMLKMSRIMGGVNKPVHTAVREALVKHKGYDLVLCGHSLGAGVAALLGLTWADPSTCRTVPASGLPAGRRLSVYCFASPCICDAALGKRARGMITSISCGRDVVSRLSLGSVHDMTRAAVWLCAAGREGEGSEGAGAVTKRALRFRAGMGKEGDEEWFLAMRKTLEANMHMADLFPPGRVWWTVRDEHLHPSNRLPDATKNKLRLFEVLDVEKVFGQVDFSGDMLSSHLPHRYDSVVHELL